MNGSAIRFVLFVAAISPAVGAQQQYQLEEIVVTAQRREQNLQEVPVAVTAFTAGQIERGRIRGMQDYFSLTPNVSFSTDAADQAGSRGLNIGIRGINNLTSGENSVINSIGIYLDEFSVASFPGGSINPFMPDMERIEVLRGPQGTYFGRNAVAGALNLTTKAPSEDFGVKATLDGQDFARHGQQNSLSTVVNMPFGSNFLTRGVAYFEDSTGKVKNVRPNGAGTGHEYTMLRLNALWTPTDATTVRFTGMYSDEDQEGDESVPSGVWNVDTVDGYLLGVDTLTAAVDPGGIGFWPDNRHKVDRDLDEFTKVEALVGILNISHQINENVALKSITGVINGKQSRLFDNDLVGGWDSFYRQGERDGMSYSSELRLEVTNSAFDWTSGVLYARDDQDQENQVLAGTATEAPIGPLGPDPAGFVLLPPLPPNFCFLCDEKSFELESLAVFTDFTWHATDRLDLIVGGRYTHDEVTTETIATGTIFPDLMPLNEAQGKQSFDDVSPRFAARYQLSSDASVYGTVSKGYKAGGTSLGFNADPVNVPLPEVIETPFKEETLWNYEVGLKSQWLDNRLRFNASAFFMEWSDLQLEVFRFLVPGNLQSKFALTSNVSEAEARGLEIEFAASITERFSVSGGLGFLDTEIQSSALHELSGGFLVSLEGLDIPKSPSFTANAVGEYHVPVGAGEGWLRLEYVHRSGQMSNVEALAWEQTRGEFLPNHGMNAYLPESPGGFPFVTPDYDLINMRAGFDWNRFEFTLFVNNLFDEEYYTGTAEDYSVSGIRIRPNPRVVGGSVSYTFGDIR